MDYGHKKGILKVRSTPALLFPDHTAQPYQYCEVPYIPNPRNKNYVEAGYTFNPLKTAPKESKIRFSPEPKKMLKRSKSARTPSPSFWNEDKKDNFTRSQKGSSFMRIIKKAKGSISRPGSAVRRSSACTSPTFSQRSSPSSRSTPTNVDCRYTLSSPELEQQIMRRPPSSEQNLIRIWADQVEGGVAGYKGFLISPDTTARELLTTVHSKLNLPGTDKDFFLCAKFFHSSISDRPLIDTDRPLCLHEDWDEQENYRFELRQKPKARIMVYGDDQLRFSRTPFLRGVVEIAEDATTSRLVTELVSKYALDPCQRYHLLEKRPNFDRVMKSTDNPVLLQKRWLPQDEIKFVLTTAPNTPDLFTQLVAPSQFSSRLSSSPYQTTDNSNTSFTNVTPCHSSFNSQRRPCNQRLSFPPSTSSVASSMELEGFVPDFESADLTFNSNISEKSEGLSETQSFTPRLLDENFSEHIMNIGIPQQKIHRGFEEMQNRWLGNSEVNDRLPDSQRRAGTTKRLSCSSEDLRSIEEYLFADLNRSPDRPGETTTSFEQSEFLDNPVLHPTPEYFTSTPRDPDNQHDDPCISNYPRDNVSLDQTGDSFRMSFGTSNDSDSEPELFIGAKSTLLNASSCSDSGVNVSDSVCNHSNSVCNHSNSVCDHGNSVCDHGNSDVSSYRPVDQERSFEQTQSGAPGEGADNPTVTVNIISPLDSARLSSGEEELGQVPSEVSTPRNLSVTSVTCVLQDMSWDNFEMARANFQSEEEYEQYLKHLAVQSEIKRRSGHFGEELSDIPDIVSESDYDLTRSEDSITTSDVFDETLIECPQSGTVVRVSVALTEVSLDSESSHRETSDKENIYNTSATDTSNTSMITHITESGESSASSGLALTESLALLEETKKLYDVLEEKTNRLEEKYFSPEKMKSALSDPLGNAELNKSKLLKEVLTDDPSAQSNLISKSIEFFEQLSQTSSEQIDSPTKSKNNYEVENTADCQTSSPVIEKQSCSVVDQGIPLKTNSGQEDDFTIDADDNTLSSLCKPKQKLQPSSIDNFVEKSAFKSESISDIEDTEIKVGITEKKQLKSQDSTNIHTDTDTPPNVPESDTPDHFPRHKKISDTNLSQISVSTDLSRSTANTESTARLRESVERLKFEIEDVLHDCNESFATSLDTERHNLSDTTYEQLHSPMSNSLEKTIVSDEEEHYLSEDDSNASNPVILDGYCSDPEADADEIEEMFETLLVAAEAHSEKEDELSTVDLKVTYNSDHSESNDIHYVECDLSDTSGDCPDITSIEDMQDLNSVMIVSRGNTHSDVSRDNTPSDVSRDNTHGDVSRDNIPSDVSRDNTHGDTSSESIGPFKVDESPVVIKQETRMPPSDIPTEKQEPEMSDETMSETVDETDPDDTENCLSGDNISLNDESLSALSDNLVMLNRIGDKTPTPSKNENNMEDIAQSELVLYDPEAVDNPMESESNSLDNVPAESSSTDLKPTEPIKLIKNFDKAKQEHVPGCEAEVCREPDVDSGTLCSANDMYLQDTCSCPSPAGKDTCPSPAGKDIPYANTSEEIKTQAERIKTQAEQIKTEAENPATSNLCAAIASLSTVLDIDNPPRPETPSDIPTVKLESILGQNAEFTPASEGRVSTPNVPTPDTSYGAAYDEQDTSDSEYSETDSDVSETLSANYKSLCNRLKNLKNCFKRDKYGKIIDLEEDEVSGLTLYEIKLPCIWEEEANGDVSSPHQILRSMPHADLKRQYKNLLAEIEETKPKLRQLEVLQSELTTMQKAYHDLKEQALRMSIEQDAQKNQIEEEIKKLKISNQDLIKKNKSPDSKENAVVTTIMELEKLYSDRILALERALKQKDDMVGDLEEQNRNMMTQLNVTRRQSVQLETANELLHKRNEVLVVEKQDGEINPAQFFDSDNERLALLAKQCDALQQTVSSLESTLMLRVKELNETYEDLDTMRSDLRVAEVARIEAEAQLDVNKREVGRLQNVNEDLAEEIKEKIAENGKLEQDNKHLQENVESLQLQYDDCKDRVNRLENALLTQEKALEAIKGAEKSAKGELTELEKRLEVASQSQRKKDEEMRKLRKEVEKAKKGSSMYNLCTAIKPGETLELISVDLPAITEQIPRGLYIQQGPHGVYIDKIDVNSSAGRLHRLSQGDRIVEVNLNDVSNASFEVVKREVDSARAMQLVVARVAPDIRNESKLRAEALKDQIKGLVIDLDKTARHCQGLQVESADLKDDIANLKAKQRSELGSASNQKTRDEIQNLKALLAQKEQYLKTLETTVRSKNELLVTMEMDSHRSPRATPNTSINQHNSFSPGLSSTASATKEADRKRDRDSSKDDSISELVNRYG